MSPSVTNFFVTPFHWSQIESSDYFVFVKNLRRVHCPESVIRDIIVADVEDTFSQRRLEIVWQSVEDFWSLIVDQAAMEKMISEKEAELRELHDKKQNTLEALLGPSQERKSFFDSYDRWSARLCFLSPQKREQVLELHEQFHPRCQHEYESGATNAQALGTRLQELNRSFEAALAKLLSPVELEQYELQTAPAAEMLRKRLNSFEPTESEFRKVYAQQRGLEAQHTNAVYSPNTLSDSDIGSIRKEVDEQFLLALSPERRADFERSKNEHFCRAYCFTQRVGLPRIAAIQLHDIRRETIEMAKRVKADRTLSKQEQLDQLGDIEAGKAERVIRVIGTSNYKAFKENGL